MSHQHNRSSGSSDFLPNGITEQGLTELVKCIEARIAGGDSPLGPEGKKALDLYGGKDAPDPFSQEVDRRVRNLRSKIGDEILSAFGYPPGQYGWAILNDELHGGQAAQNN